MLPDRHPQQDMFVCDIVDAAPKQMHRNDMQIVITLPCPNTGLIITIRRGIGSAHKRIITAATINYAKLECLLTAG